MKMGDKAILVNGVVTPVDDIFVWGRWFETAERRIGSDDVLNFHVSTVFLGLDHGWDEECLWFETMIFGPPYMSELFGKPHLISDDLYMARYSTLEEAKVGHELALIWLQERLDLSTDYQLQLCWKEGETRNEESIS
jgi:hypothetical protein